MDGIVLNLVLSVSLDDYLALAGWLVSVRHTRISESMNM